MITRRLSIPILVMLALSTAGATSAVRAQTSPSPETPSYHATEIPGIPQQGYSYVFPADINNHGFVVGILERFPGFVPVRAFLWDGHGPVQDLGDLGVYEFVQAVGINDANQVAGYAEVLEPRTPLGIAFRAFLWQDGIMTALPPLGGDLESQAIAINELGEVLVLSYDRSNPDHNRYYIWRNGRVDSIGRLSSYPGGPSGFAWSMNNARQIVGSAVAENGQERAFLWDNGQMIDLGLAPGDDFYSVAYRITNGGTIVGESAAFDSENGHGARSQGVVWEGSNLVRTIAPLPGDYLLAPLAANESGTVVGFSGFPASAIVSFGGPAFNLNDLTQGQASGKFLYEGRDVNDLGQIVVDGMFGCCGYLLEPL